MNKKNTTYLIVLIVLILIYAATKLNNKTEKIIDFFAFDSSDVYKIEITNQTDTLKLALNSGEWSIVYPVECKVKDNKIKDIFSKVLKVKTSKTALSESKKSHENYNVTDSLGTKITFIGKNGKTLDSVVIGKSKNYSYSNGRKANDDNVYQLLANISYSINPRLLSWRDRTIFKYEDDQISQLDVKYGKKNYKLTYVDSIWVYESGKKKEDIKKDSKELKSLLTSLRNYNASDFKDNEYEEYKDKFAKPDLEVTIHTFDNDSMHLRYIKIEDNKFLLQKNDETEHLYVIYKNLVDKFKKTDKDFNK